MSSEPAAITFVGHDASRTGAPSALLTMLRWLQRQSDVELRVLLRSGGPLALDYRDVCRVDVTEGTVVGAATLVSSVARSVGRNLDLAGPLRRIAARRGASADVVVANTLASLETAVAIAGSRRGNPPRLVCWVHELDGVASRVLPANVDTARGLLDRVDAFAAVSAAVRSMLVDRFGVPPERVVVVEPFIEVPNPTSEAVELVRTELGGAARRPVVLAVGAMGRRKGPERFVDLLGLLADRNPQPVGVWLGGEPRSTAWRETEADLIHAGLDDTFRLVPPVVDASAHLAAADVVVSTAVEDPYPLVALEAGALGTPVVGYASGGLRDLTSDCGLDHAVVEVGDLLGLRDLVEGLLADEELRVAHGRAAREWIKAHRLVDQGAPALWDVICG